LRRSAASAGLRVRELNAEINAETANGQHKLPVKPSGNSTDKSGADKHGTEDGGDRYHRATHFVQVSVSEPGTP
jgi:hypothetical protein